MTKCTDSYDDERTQCDNYDEFVQFDDFFIPVPDAELGAAPFIASNLSERYAPSSKGVNDSIKSYAAQSGTIYTLASKDKNESLFAQKRLYSVSRQRTDPIGGWLLFYEGAQISQFSAGLHFKKVIQALDILNRQPKGRAFATTEAEVYGLLSRNGW